MGRSPDKQEQAKPTTHSSSIPVMHMLLAWKTGLRNFPAVHYRKNWFVIRLFFFSEHYQVKRTCTDDFEVNFFMVNHACMTEGHRHGHMCFCEEDECNSAISQISNQKIWVTLLISLGFARLLSVIAMQRWSEKHPMVIWLSDLNILDYFSDSCVWETQSNGPYNEKGLDEGQKGCQLQCHHDDQTAAFSRYFCAIKTPKMPKK